MEGSPSKQGEHTKYKVGLTQWDVKISNGHGKFDARAHTYSTTNTKAPQDTQIHYFNTILT